MCYSRLQRGEQPVCVESCIAGAIRIGNIYEDYSPEYKSSLKEYAMKTITNPSTRFKYEKQEKTHIWAAERGDCDDSIDL